MRGFCVAAGRRHSCTYIGRPDPASCSSIDIKQSPLHILHGKKPQVSRRSKLFRSPPHQRPRWPPVPAPLALAQGTVAPADALAVVIKANHFPLARSNEGMIKSTALLNTHSFHTHVYIIVPIKHDVHSSFDACCGGLDLVALMIGETDENFTYLIKSVQHKCSLRYYDCSSTLLAVKHEECFIPNPS